VVSAPAACPGCENETTQVFEVQGLDCASEVALIEQHLSRAPGVCSVRASAVTGQATVVHTLASGSVERLLAEVGLRATEARRVAAPPLRAGGTLAALALGVAGFAAGFVSAPLAVAFYLPAIVIGGAPIARKGWQRARHGALDMNVLMSVAVLGAMAIGEWGEGAATVVLFSLAQLLEARSLERARRAISGLMDLAPETAVVLRGGAEAQVAAAEVARGEAIVVAPGARVPLDGIVESGRSDVDQSPLTGESQPVPREAGQGVFAGSINGSGALVVRVTRRAAETTLARILRRVEEAQASRAPTQGFVERFARVYTPVVIGLALLTALVPPLLAGGAWSVWTYRALVLLVVACPCALVISTPVSIVSALTAASRRGVLVKGGAHLEELGRVRAVVFDKTGTLTRGAPEVTDVLAADGVHAREVLALAAAVEARAAHPLALAVTARARHEGLALDAADEVTEIPGRGVRGRVNGSEVLVGSHRLFDERGLCDHRLDETLARLEAEGKTAVLVGLPGREAPVLGALAVADALRPEAREAVAALHAAGIAVAMLSGDNARTTGAIARQLGIETALPNLLPDDKVARLLALRDQRGSVAMVGDGINDAPALAAASVGIAMGRRSADVALETAAVALMAEDLRLIPQALRLGRAARRVVRQNVALSLLVKGAVLGLTLAGWGSLWAAVGADMGASLLVIGNGLRLLRAR
jgi:Zn2+/Cd2+-exporting ATPase